MEADNNALSITYFPALIKEFRYATTSRNRRTNVSNAETTGVIIEDIYCNRRVVIHYRIYNHTAFQLLIRSYRKISRRNKRIQIIHTDKHWVIGNTNSERI